MRQFPYRYIARIVVEAETPLAVGSDTLLLDQDSPVSRDFNGLPYIPGTAIAGFLRHKLKNIAPLFGEDPDSIKKQPEGSKIVVSDAYLLDNEKKVHQRVEVLEGDFFERYFNLPIRQHVAIDHFGAAKDGSLFDREIVYKGSRFKFEIAFESENEQSTEWENILCVLYDNDFYLGSGEFNNFGELKVVELQERKFDLNSDLEDYLNLTVDLNQSLSDLGFKKFQNSLTALSYEEKKITLSGENSFFHFGAGYGDYKVDAVNYQEEVLVWKENSNYEFTSHYVIPGTSIKGVLSHRTAFYYNKAQGNTIESFNKLTGEEIQKEILQGIDLDNYQVTNSIEELEKQKEELLSLLKSIENDNKDYSSLFKKFIGENNSEIQKLFGTAKKSDIMTGNSGSIIIKDIYLKPSDVQEHIFYHNKIDRYTGGTIDQALYNEKVLYLKKNIELLIKCKKEAKENQYFEAALQDIKAGQFPIGGLVNKGHGIINEIKIEENDNNK